ncbi:oligogalacturonate lyase [Spirochaetales bacterium BR193]|uniref:Oligogalacturonate lyase n=2 Tax=Entomospira entomophila TaxID=2719988 RepID=A0A968GAN2_9SPIO|nr:oligogalacturonate lyase [Entomospira entomophilus]
MMKGNQVQLTFEELVDAKTGRTTIRLTPKENIFHRNYFYQKCFTSDNKKLLIGGTFDDPDSVMSCDDFKSSLNYHLLDLESGLITQLTEGNGDNTFGGFLSHDDQYLYYVKNRKALNRVQLNTLEEITIFESDSKWVAYGTWVANSTTTKMVGIEIAKDDYINLDTWDAFAKMYERNPLCRLFTLDLTTGEQKIIHQEKRWLGHPMYRPFDDKTVAFCHEGPHDLVKTRIWFIDEDGSNLRAGINQDEDEHCTHEFWVPDGSLMYYVSFYSGAPKHRFICSVNPDTLESKKILQMPNCSHLMSNYNGTLLVGDGTCSPMDVANKEANQIETDNDLYLFDIANSRVSSIAEHHSSWDVFKGSRQITHPHPSFTPDNTAILWSSDCEGNTAVYLTKLE